MNTNPATTRTCPSCHAALPPDAPDGLCPSCLLQTQTVASSAGSAPGPSPRPAAGSTFAGYRIERLLGRGGMGEVFEAEHLATGRRVALKVMNHGLSSDQDRKRFLREGRLAASVNHPNVVYIHGGEEVNGTPIIAMELVRDGTLKDRLRKQGPLPVAEAVSAILQVMAGLEAAHARGVLHRDIKPANCFVSADGIVKVGDFGLSVSTLARGESLLTATGAVLGTPAYASPEQLRGEELDVTSDIYSVGATLYHLLTGRTPFKATDFVKLITEVLDRTPEAPQAFRPEIPAELASIVLRCLAKDRVERFRDYRALREALLPFSGAMAAPARPGLRFLAGFIDEIIAWTPAMAYAVYSGFDPVDQFTRERTWVAGCVALLFALGYLAYYTVSEGLWGAAFGKSLLGLRVVALDGGVAGSRKTFVRALIWHLPIWLPGLLLVATKPLAELQAARAEDAWVWTDLLEIALFPALLMTMRLRNGYAGVHDLVSRTRVVVRPRTHPRPALGRPPQAPLPLAPWPTPAYGPYVVRGSRWEHRGEALVEAFDEALQRRVWIHVRARTGDPVTPDRKELDRPTRLRWLHDGVAGETRWDAYDAIEGTALVDLLGRPQAWDAVRFWMLDTALELQAQLQHCHGTAILSGDRVWITQTNRAVWLDFPAPALRRPGGPEGQSSGPDAAWLFTRQPIADVADLQRFLSTLSRIALEGWPTRSAPSEEPRVPVPLDARAFLGSLARGAFERVEYVLGNLESLANRDAVIPKTRRAISITAMPLAVGLLALALAAGVGLTTITWNRAWTNTFPGRPPLRAAADEYVQALQEAGNGFRPRHEAELARVYLVSHFGDILTNDVFWTNAVLTETMSKVERDILRGIALGKAARPELAEEAERFMAARIRERETAARFDPLFVLVAGILYGPLIFAGLELAASVWSGRSWILHLFGLCAVDRRGRPAPRWRMLGRWFLVWGPLGLTMGCGGWALIALMDEGLVRYLRTGTIESHTVVVSTAFLVCLVATGLSVIQAIRNPECSLPDRLAGTRLVLR